ncbi:Glyoxalase/Bleomycin resistance protein/Dihydroxybiphenyl dioxygenase [Xylariales sp. PMI_506]|nr:Glyoxalase/Bleomycin resistance protein/Dihydroxybiphenyl dioxygenase [Xylariales sp. PMI_506]
MPLNHVSLATGLQHFAAMRSFYLSALAPLNYIIYWEKENFMVGLKPRDGIPDFWLHAGATEQTPYSADVEPRPGRTHLAFEAENRETVDKWYEAAIAAGGVCNGPPGVRASISPNYYGAFVLDPLGNNVECVHYRPKPSQ